MDRALISFFRGWLLIVGLKKGLVECVTVYVKSEVILPKVLMVLEVPIEFQELLKVEELLEVVESSKNS